MDRISKKIESLNRVPPQFDGVWEIYSQFVFLFFELWLYVSSAVAFPPNSRKRATEKFNLEMK